MKQTEAQLERRLKVWQQKLSHLGVGHFRIQSVSITHEMGEPTAAATSYIYDFYDTVYFEFDANEINEADEQTLDERCIHEWLHVAMRDWDKVIERVEQWMPEATMRDYSAAVDHEREGLVERLARQLYAFHSETC